jgi:hypothetical protein
MTTAIGRAAAAAILAALFGAAWAALFYAWHPAIAIEFDRDLPKNVTGIYPPERDDGSGLTFAWTGPAVVVRLPGLDRRANWMLAVRARGARALASENPALVVLVDGVVVATEKTTTDFSEMRVTMPARERRGLVLELRPSATFVPGPSDARALGVMLDRVSLTPDRVLLVPRPALMAASVAAAAMGAALALLGVTAGSAIGGAILLGAGAAAVVDRGFGPFTDYPRLVLVVGVWIAVALASLSLVVQSWRGPLRNTARFAAAFSAAALFLKLLILLHPNMPIGDAMFHAHRFQGVLAGNYFFTSIAPGGYAFPYPPGLYVFASLFAGLVRRGAADVTLLRIVTCAVDAVAGLILYAAIVRRTRRRDGHDRSDAAAAHGGDVANRLAAAVAVALYNLIPVGLAVLTTGNLTNAFAQSVAVGALVLMAIDETRIERWAWTLALTVTIAIAYLSHTGTLAILFVATVATALLFLVRGGPALRSPAAAVGVATLTAAALAVVLYYAHFLDTYRTEFARIGHETATAASDAGGRTIADRVRVVPYSIRIYVGIPVLLLAILGAVPMMSRYGRHRLTLALGGWTMSCGIFLVIGVLTPVDMRYYLASLPALAIAAGGGVAWAWHDTSRARRAIWRVAAALFLAAAVSTGFHNWWSALG